MDMLDGQLPVLPFGGETLTISIAAFTPDGHAHVLCFPAMKAFVRDTVVYGGAIVASLALWAVLLFASVTIANRLALGVVGGLIVLVAFVALLIKGAEAIDRRRGITPH
jgi:hypothetical protein